MLALCVHLPVFSTWKSFRRAIRSMFFVCQKRGCRHLKLHQLFLFLVFSHLFVATGVVVAEEELPFMWNQDLLFKFVPFSLRFHSNICALIFMSINGKNYCHCNLSTAWSCHREFWKWTRLCFELGSRSKLSTHLYCWKLQCQSLWLATLTENSPCWSPIAQLLSFPYPSAISQ